jgi:hypothetical protein
MHKKKKRTDKNYILDLDRNEPLGLETNYLPNLRNLVRDT